MRHNSYTISKKQYDYLLPVFGFAAQGPTKLLARGNDFFFIGTHTEYLDALTRCLYL
jgi:hypothetical protein